METEKKKRGRPPKNRVTETTGMTYDGAINYTLDKQVRAELDESLADKDESQLTEDERKYLKTKREKKAYTWTIVNKVDKKERKDHREESKMAGGRKLEEE